MNNDYSFIPEVPLVLSPRYGNILGGQEVRVAGPCFDNAEDFTCVFDGIEVRGIYLNEYYVLCVSPQLSRTGRVPFELMVDRTTLRNGSFTSCKLSISFLIDNSNISV